MGVKHYTAEDLGALASIVRRQQAKPAFTLSDKAIVAFGDPDEWNATAARLRELEAIAEAASELVDAKVEHENFTGLDPDDWPLDVIELNSKLCGVVMACELKLRHLVTAARDAAGDTKEPVDD